MIEPCWLWIKRQTTRKGVLRTRKDAEERQLYCWNHELIQKRIQEWIERIPRYIVEVIRLKGGNEYREGREGGDVRFYNSTERANEYIRSYMKHHHQKNEAIQEKGQIYQNAKHAKRFSACAGLLMSPSVSSNTFLNLISFEILIIYYLFNIFFIANINIIKYYYLLKNL